MRSVAPGSRGSRLRELAALVHVMARFWLAVFPCVRAELRGWKRRAAAIPDPALREQALATLRSERLSAAGAALFAATTPRLSRPTRRALVRALAAYQAMCDVLDTLGEDPGPDAIADGAQLHRALADAVGDGPLADHYALHGAHDDGGYLAALVAACREGCAALPAWEAVRAAARREAARNEVQGINHAPAGVREPALRLWAATAARDDTAAGDAHWFELAAAGSSSLATLALIAAAADPATDVDVAERVRRAYFPWIEALSTLLDSVADRERDLRTGELCFVDQHPSREAAAARMAQVAARALAGARGLPRGERHVVLVAGMVAMHVSEAGAWSPWSAPVTRAVLDATATPAMAPLLALLRGWRRVRGERVAPVDATDVPDATAGACAGQAAVRPTGQLTPVPPSPQ